MWRARDLLTVGLALGLAGGLVEGPVHMLLQRLNVLENLWWEIVWIAPVVNGLLMGVVALVVAAGLSLFPGRSWMRQPAIFALVFVACLPVLVLALKEWVRWYSVLILTAGLSVALTRWLVKDVTARVRTCRRVLRVAAALTVVLFVGVQSGFWLRERMGVSALPPASVGAPDILVIVIDALRADHLASYGYSRPTSPNIDRLGAEGVLFEQAFSTASYTLPSHASILTGLYPSQHNVEWQTARTYATASYPTLPEVLQGRGYRTGAFSGNTFWFTRAQGFGRGFLHFDDFFSSIADMALRTAYGRMVTVALQKLRLWEDIPARKRAPATNRAILEWLDRDAEHPALAVVNYMDVHDPFLPPQPFRNKFSSQPNPGGLLNWQLHVPDTLTPPELQREIDAYDGAIAFTDDQIGALLTSIRARHRPRGLLVIVTSDHGDEFGEHGRFLHARHLYREVIRVPLIVWWPGRVADRTRVSRPVSNASVPATIMSLLDPGDRTFQVATLQRLWESPETAADHPLPLIELRQRPWAPERDPVHDGSMRSLVGPQWHFIDHEMRGAELYDWTSDPREAVNVATDPNRRGVIEEFRRWLAAGPVIRDRE